MIPAHAAVNLVLNNVVVTQRDYFRVHAVSGEKQFRQQPGALQHKNDGLDGEHECHGERVTDRDLAKSFQHVYDPDGHRYVVGRISDLRVDPVVGLLAEPVQFTSNPGAACERFG